MATAQTGGRTPVVGDRQDPLQRSALAPDAQPITARLAAAGSRRFEIEALLGTAPPDASVDELRELVLRANVAGKGSAASRAKVWWQLRARYMLDPSIAEYRAFASALRAGDGHAERGLVCFLMMARSDRLFREVALECVSPYLARGGTVIENEPVDRALRSRLAGAGLTWSEETIETVRQHFFSALKDFDLIRGSRTRRTVRPRPGAPTTLFAARLGRCEGLTDRQVLESRWFRLLGLDGSQVADLFYAAQRAGILGFQMQADVVELRLPPLESNR